MGRNLTKQEVLDVCELSLKKFNNAYLCDSISNLKNTDKGIGDAIEPYICEALCEVTGVKWRRGHHNKECDFICEDPKYNPFELKTAISAYFTGGVKSGRESILLQGKDSTKYSLKRNDGNKICIYDDVQYILIKIDRPWNGWNTYYINQIYHGNLKEIDWSSNQRLYSEKLNKLLILDNSNTYERKMRYPYHQETKTNKNINFTLEDSGKNVITNTYNIDLLLSLKKLIDVQIGLTKNIIEQQIKRLANTLDNNSLDNIIKYFEELKENNLN